MNRYTVNSAGQIEETSTGRVVDLGQEEQRLDCSENEQPREAIIRMVDTVVRTSKFQSLWQ